MSGCHVPSCLGTCCGDMKERISKLELAMNNEAENCSYMSMDERITGIEEALKQITSDQNAMYLCRIEKLEEESKYLYIENEERKRSHNYLADAFIGFKEKFEKLMIEEERRLNDLIKNFNNFILKDAEFKSTYSSQVDIFVSSIKKLEEQVKVLQSVINSAQQDSVTDLVENKPKNSDKLRDLMRNGPLITDPTFYEALDDSKPDESDMLKNNCDCDCHNLLVNSHCLDCLNNHPESKKRRENIMHSLAKDIDNHIQQAIGPQKKTKTYWVNVYETPAHFIRSSKFQLEGPFETLEEAIEVINKKYNFIKTISFQLELE